MANPDGQADTNSPAEDPFKKVMADELRQINRTRKVVSPSARDAMTGEGTSLTGLALSGGGIRSATFCLGMIQSLCEKELLRHFDYLSTVSGGGYIGAWLSAQIYRRCPDGTPKELEAKLSPTTEKGVQKDREDPSIVFLREYSNYLTPRLGLLSTDTLAAIAAYLRNLTLIQSMLILMLSFLLLVPRVLFLLMRWTQSLVGQDAEWPVAGMIGIVAVLLWVSIRNIERNMNSNGNAKTACTSFVLVRILGPGILASFILTAAMTILATLDHPLPRDGVLTWIAVFVVIFGVGSTMLPAERRNVEFDAPANKPQTGPAPPSVSSNRARWRNRCWIVFFGLFAGATGGFGLWLVRSLLGVAHATFGTAASGAPDVQSVIWIAISVAPFLILGVLSLIIVVHLGLVGRIFEYEVQEWWARYGGWLMSIIVFVGGIFVVSVYGPALVVFGSNWARAGGAAWLLASLWGVLKGASNKTGGPGPSWTERLLVVVPHVFIIGLLILLSYAIHAIWQAALDPSDVLSACSTPHKGDSHPYLCVLDTTLAQMTAQTSLPVVKPWAHMGLVVMLGTAAAWALLAWRVDVNLFSLHNFYRNRLTRCYLGASRCGDGNRKREPDPFTGFDPADDIPLDRLAACKPEPEKGGGATAQCAPPQGDEGAYVQRPYHLLNTSVNLTEGESLAWQQRKAGSFFFSPLYCGFGLPQAYVSRQEGAGKFVRTADYMRTGSRSGSVRAPSRKSGTLRDVGPMLGGAVAISGAAASPNWGFHTDPGVAFLLTLFNVRLGRWCPNPVRETPEGPVPPSPAFSGKLYLNELFGHADAKSDYLYLSDGGHFDNLGLYELVRRRTELIVVCDCGEDAPLHFDDLADTIRKCSADFGVDIVIDVDPLRHLEKGSKRPPPQSKAYVVDGIIKYPASSTDPTVNAFCGTLILVKPTLTKDVISTASDLVNYALTNDTFPQQTTLDQWFDEAQFESYRKLGYLIGCRLQKKSFGKMFEKGKTLQELLHGCTGIE
ncbi:patatin-like phospholipase family protein [Caballeronia novacaledonica]|uniref:Patatin-like phospholipase family protein n=1 Tax=Caballeronia novacaledonica TaxID=1544861 RepID=A0AA37MT98_9BURK|nr:patatin-like phospholipase family protein [Caballeronia novacaledonica]GJH27447.1 patatin-like phospholipase family protein [Caballeronia novacaledonica]